MHEDCVLLKLILGLCTVVNLVLGECVSLCKIVVNC